MYSDERANKELKSIISQFKDSYRIACDSSRDAYMKTLAAGAPIPKEGSLYGETFKNEFESMCSGYRDKARKIVEKKLSELREEVTKAPSTEAVNSITLLNMRNNITEAEIDDLLTRYGDNVQAWRTIVSIARDHNIYAFRDNDIDERIAAAESLERTLDKALSAQSAIGGRASDGFLSMVELDIDKVFPIEG